MLYLATFLYTLGAFPHHHAMHAWHLFSLSHITSHRLIALVKRIFLYVMGALAREIQLLLQGESPFFFQFSSFCVVRYDCEAHHIQPIKGEKVGLG